MEFSRQEYWSKFPFPPTGYLPDPEIQPTSVSLHWQMDSLPLTHFFCISAASGLQTQKGTLTWSLELASFHSCISQILTINNKYAKLCVFISIKYFFSKCIEKKSILLVLFFFFFCWITLKQQVSSNFFLSIFCLCYDYCCIWLQLNNYCNSCLLFHSVNITKLKCIFFYQNIWISPFIFLLL